MSPEDFARIDTFSIEEQKDLGQRFLRAFRDHPYSSDLEDRKQTIENAGWYGKMCATAVSKLKEPGAVGLEVYNWRAYRRCILILDDGCDVGRVPHRIWYGCGKEWRDSL
ncbi:MAG: hypothetical protein K5929_00065 [Lachnospiraceae bacterium]|nr:hypothetical protein [Lachnospiraceae bacterium]